MRNKNRFDHSGSTFDGFLDEQGLLAHTEALALKRVLAWQLKRAMTAKKITKNAMARQLRTSRSQVDRLLDPLNVGVSLETIARAANAVGRRVSVQILAGESSGTRAARGRMRAKNLQKAG